MTLSSKIFDLDQSLRSHWGWFFGLGVLLFGLGLAGLVCTTTTTLITIIFLGGLIFLSGLLVIIDAFRFWWHYWSGFLLHFLLGLLYVVVGFMLIERPLVASVSLTLLLGIFYLVAGLFRLIYATTINTPFWGLRFVNALISILLGVLILAAWPSSSLYIIGLFVSIDLLFSGLTYMMVGISAKSR